MIGGVSLWEAFILVVSQKGAFPTSQTCWFHRQGMRHGMTPQKNPSPTVSFKGIPKTLGYFKSGKSLKARIFLKPHIGIFRFTKLGK